VYFSVVISVSSDSVNTASSIAITGAVIRVQKIKLNGEAGSAVGHFDTVEGGDWKPFCCGTSKFHVGALSI
jgi:hypothetical protein